jgi:ABC-type antimicrobial peptide transport system ATPase subunit
VAGRGKARALAAIDEAAAAARAAIEAGGDDVEVSGALYTDDDLVGIPGAPPSLRDPPPGCRFNPRCDQAIDRCRTVEPALVALGGGRQVACHVAVADPPP